MDKYGYYLNDYENISNLINLINDMHSDNIFRYKMILQELVDKATLKKVEVNRNDTQNCPNCGGFIFQTYNYNFCGNCGQALDWSE